MNAPSRLVSYLFVVLVVVAGCASTRLTRRDYYTGEPLPRPDRIIVYDFAATAADIPAGSAHPYREPSIPPSAEEIAVGRQLGAQVAEELVAAIRDMGLPAVRAAGQPGLRVGDYALMGYFESVDPGSRTKRLALGFGSGAAELRTAVEAYQMTNQGLRRLGGGEVNSVGGKAPGLPIPVAMAIAGNPIGLAVSGAAHIQGEMSGRTTIEGSAKRTAKEVAEQLRQAFERQGWI